MVSAMQDATPTMPALSELSRAWQFWQRIADENGWTIGSLTLFVDNDGHIVDSVAVREGDALYVVVDDSTDEDAADPAERFASMDDDELQMTRDDDALDMDELEAINAELSERGLPVSGWEGNEELAAEHRLGLHADTARQDCPLCADFTEEV